MRDAVNASGIQIPLGFNCYPPMQVVTGKRSDAQLQNTLMHEIVSNIVRVASHVLGYNIVSYFHLHVHLQSYSRTRF